MNGLEHDVATDAWDACHLAQQKRNVADVVDEARKTAGTPVHLGQSRFVENPNITSCHVDPMLNVLKGLVFVQGFEMPEELEPLLKRLVSPDILRQPVVAREDHRKRRIFLRLGRSLLHRSHIGQQVDEVKSLGVSDHLGFVNHQNGVMEGRASFLAVPLEGGKRLGHIGGGWGNLELFDDLLGQNHHPSRKSIEPEKSGLGLIRHVFGQKFEHHGLSDPERTDQYTAEFSSFDQIDEAGQSFPMLIGKVGETDVRDVLERFLFEVPVFEIHTSEFLEGTVHPTAFRNRGDSIQSRHDGAEADEFAGGWGFGGGAWRLSGRRGSGGADRRASRRFFLGGWGFTGPEGPDAYFGKDTIGKSGGQSVLPEIFGNDKEGIWGVGFPRQGNGDGHEIFQGVFDSVGEGGDRFGEGENRGDLHSIEGPDEGEKMFIEALLFPDAHPGQDRVEHHALNGLTADHLLELEKSLRGQHDIPLFIASRDILAVFEEEESAGFDRLGHGKTEGFGEDHQVVGPPSREEQAALIELNPLHGELEGENRFPCTAPSRDQQGTIPVGPAVALVEKGDAGLGFINHGALSRSGHETVEHISNKAHFKGFGQKVVHPEAVALLHRVGVALAGDHHDRTVGTAGAHLADEFDSVRSARHEEVRDDQSDFRIGGGGEAAFPVHGALHLVTEASQEGRKIAANDFIVVNHQDLFHSVPSRAYRNPCIFFSDGSIMNRALIQNKEKIGVHGRRIREGTGAFPRRRGVVMGDHESTPREGGGGEEAVVLGPPRQGTRCHCAHCRISVHVVATPPPVVCPYCQAALVRVPYELPPLSPSLAQADHAERFRALYRRPPAWLVFLAAGFGTLLLAWAVFVQVTNVENYWYAPLVNLYSLVAGIFILSRFILASFYQAPAEVGLEPTVSVLVPAMNEEEAIGRTLDQIFAAGYPDAKLEVVAVNDGSRDRTLMEMLKAQSRHPNLIVVDFEKNRGLCHGWAVGTLLARGEILVCVDSDTFLFPGSLRKIVQGFADPTVGGIAGHCDVENARTNLLTRMQDVRYFFSYKIMKAAESVHGCVSCLPGCFSAYRRVCVLHVLDEWLNAKVWGEYGNFADDRSLTNLILRDYRILYDDEALATTIAPNRWSVYIRQQARWMRSYLREILKTSRFIWRKHPIPSLSWYIMMFLPLTEPFVMLQAIVISPLMRQSITMSYLIGVFAITLVWTLHFLQKTGRRHWWTGFLFTLTYMGFFSWQIYWALATLKGKKWGTR